MPEINKDRQLGELAKARGLMLEGLTRSVRSRALLEHGVEVNGVSMQEIEDSAFKLLEGLEDLIIFGLRLDL